MRIKLWGVRGSLPTPMDRTEYHEKLILALEYAKTRWQEDSKETIESIIKGMHPNHKSVIGGDTTCLEIRSDDTLLIFDLGTGIRKLGQEMMEKKFHGDIHIFLTHTHWDHIQGFPFFVPAYMAENHIHFYSNLKNLKERLVRQQHDHHFPVALEDMPAKMSFNYIDEKETINVGPFEISIRALVHPGGSTSYKVKEGEKICVFATDTEFYGPELSDLMDEYNEFFKNVDLLIMDAQYSLEEAEEKKGWGHTAMTLAVDCSIYWGVKQLILTHHEPAHYDSTIWHLYDEASQYYNEFKKVNPDISLELFTAKENDVYELN